MPEPSKTRFYIFCSDRPRNGKTLLCRLFCGSVPDVEAGSFHVFDTDFPDGGIARAFPDNSEVIDFSRTPGQVYLFDTVMKQESRYCLVDLEPRLLATFFQTFDDIGLDEAAHDAGVGVVIYYMLDKTYRSLEHAKEVHDRLTFSQFYLVENGAIGKPDLRAVEGEIQHLINSTRILRFPRLSEPLVGLLEDASFSLFDFMAGHDRSVPHELRVELWGLLEFLYQQRTPDREGVTHFL